MARTQRRRTLAPAALVVVLTLAAVGLGSALGNDASDPVTVRAEFGSCHEGGGTNCVVDGDTLWLAGQKLRIAGIDAPETHEPKCPAEAELGRKSAARLQALLNSGTVTAKAGGRDRDPNGRLLRDVTVDGRDVGATLIAEGLARRYEGGKKPWC